MDKEEIIEVAGKIKNLTLNLESSDAREVAKQYLSLDFINKQINNMIWIPVVWGLAYVFYALAKWLISYA